MSTLQQHSLSPAAFLRIANNILFKSVLEAQRTDAKNIFKSVSEGRRVALMTVRMQDDSDVRFDLSLDHSEYRGKMNFGAFRDSLTVLIASITEKLREENQVSVFTEETDGTMLFGITGPTEEEGQVNVLMLAANLAGMGSVHLKLQYMDSQQFQQNAAPT